MDEETTNMTDYEDIPTIVQPKNLDISLYKHQLASVYNMEKIEKDKNIVKDNEVSEIDFAINADPTGYGKCLAKDTKIIMYDGSIKKVQDIKVGELIMGDDSKPRKVLSLARGTERMYKILQNNGDSYIVNESHILSLKMRKPIRIKLGNNRIKVLYFDKCNVCFKSTSFLYSNYTDKREALVATNNFVRSLSIDSRIDIELRRYFQLPKNIRKDLKGYKVGVEFNHANVSIDPYLIGLLIGSDSGISHHFSKNDSVIADYIKTLLANYHHKKGLNGLNSLNDELMKYDMLNIKHIPLEYLINSRTNRLKLLAGIIDSTGHLQKGMYNIIHKREQLAEQIVFLSRSLGFCSCINYVTKSHVHPDNKTYYKVSINGTYLNDIPVMLEHKKVTKKSNKDYLRTNIKIEPLGIDQYYGFTIGDNHRFLLHDFTVTHNTLSMVTLILRDQMKWDLSTPHREVNYEVYSRGRMIRKKYTSYMKLPTTLIVTNQSIVKQWLKEFSHTDLDVISILTKKEAMTIDPDCYDVVIVTCTMYNKLVSRFSDCAWKRFIFDEPAHVKISSMKRTYAGFTWLVTATPDLIYPLHKQCRSSMITDLLSGFGWGFQEIIRDFVVKNQQEFIEQSFSMPETIHKYYKCYDPIFKTVQGLVSDNIASMISAGNIQDVVKAFGGTETDNVVELVKKNKQDEIDYLKRAIDVYRVQERFETIRKHEEKIQHIQKQIDELEKRFESVLDGDCPICCMKLSNPILEPKCQNIFCGNCIFKWLSTNTSCPLCRQYVDNSNLVYINRDKDGSEELNSDTDNNSNTTITKFQQIENIIEDNRNGKYIIFSSYDNTFDLIRNFLKNKNITFAEIKGTVYERDKNIRKFKEGHIQVLFLNSRNNGSGINLQEATDIILFHAMCDDTVKQVVGRSNRIGRTESLNVHHLLSSL